MRKRHTAQQTYPNTITRYMTATTDRATTRNPSSEKRRPKPASHPPSPHQNPIHPKITRHCPTAKKRGRQNHIHRPHTDGKHSISFWRTGKPLPKFSPNGFPSDNGTHTENGKTSPYIRTDYTTENITPHSRPHDKTATWEKRGDQSEPSDYRHTKKTTPSRDG